MKPGQTLTRCGQGIVLEPSHLTGLGMEIQ